MFKLENYSLKGRIQLVAGLGIVFLMLVLGLFWYMESAGIESSERISIMFGCTIVIGVVLFLVATYIGNVGANRASMLIAGIENLKKGDLSQKISISGKSDFSWMAYELDNARKNVARLVHTLVSNVTQLEGASQNVMAISKQTADGVMIQQVETDQVATAMNEMAASVQEVARTAKGAADAARKVDNEAKAGKQVVLEAIRSIDSLAKEVEKAAETLNNLEADISNIGAIVDVIRGITEQTNLLALNAAIEAARAGEHGRGFAVVADEVRTLAARTQSSTHQIEEMVGRLQQGAKAAVKVMSDGQVSAKTSVDKAASAGVALDTITTMITTMDEMSASISSAAHQQSTVAEDINRGIVNISQVAERTAGGAKDTLAAVATMSSLSADLQTAVGKFKV